MNIESYLINYRPILYNQYDRSYVVITYAKVIKAAAVTMFYTYKRRNKLDLLKRYGSNYNDRVLNDYSVVMNSTFYDQVDSFCFVDIETNTIISKYSKHKTFIELPSKDVIEAPVKKHVMEKIVSMMTDLVIFKLLRLGFYKYKIINKFIR